MLTVSPNTEMSLSSRGFSIDDSPLPPPFSLEHAIASNATITNPIINALKEAKFRWHNVKKCWYAKENENTLEIANKISNGEKIQNVPRENLELFLKQERINVKRFVTTALQDELYELPPKVANVIAQHIESSV